MVTTPQSLLSGKTDKTNGKTTTEKPTDTDLQILIHSPNEMVRSTPQYPTVKPIK